MGSNVVNPTNAPPRPGQPLPFLTSGRTKLLTEGKKVDGFNNGKDYRDEGAPLLTHEALFADQEQMSKNRKPAFAVAPGIISAPTASDMRGLGHPDEESQGVHIRQLKEAIVMDVEAHLITSTMDQMRRGVFREANYYSLNDYMKSEHYRRLREAQIQVQAMTRGAKKTNLKESATLAGIRLNPQLVKRFAAMDNAIFKKLRESKGGKRFREDFPSDFGNWGNPINPSAGSITPNFDGGDSFALAGREPDFIPLISGPYNKQLYWFDYLDMHAKAFEAWTHNPIAKRIVKVITQFVLGKGVKITVMDAERATGQNQVNPTTQQNVPVYEDYREQAQAKIDSHWMKNGMHIRCKQILQDLIVFGEQFIRYYDAPWGLRLRSLDPSTVWEVVTDPDDCENEFYIHQQYPTRYQWYVDLPVPTIKFIIRQVPAANYYHMKINATSTEVRGRSELFAILGWLKRLKEFASDRVIRNKMANLFVLDVAVEGDQSAVQTVQAQLMFPPTPGSFFVHNKAAELTGIKAEVGAGDVNMDWEMLLTVIGAGAGLSLQYLGLSAGGSKAEALVGTEPDIKTFEDYQEIIESFILQDSQRAFQRFMERKELPSDLKIKVEVTFPALAEENRSEKLKDLAFGESMSWWSHRRIASAASKELQFTSYDYDEEQEEIANEDAQKELLINTAYQQVIKGQDSATAGGNSGGGTSSGGSGKGASGMGMGKLPGASGSGSKQSESEERTTESLGRRRVLLSSRQSVSPATSPGTSAPSHVSGTATTHNASRGDKQDPWDGRDPRDVAESIKREAGNLRYERRGINRQERIQRPDQVRDQKSLDRGDLLTKARRAAKKGNLNKEAYEGGPGSGPHPTVKKFDPSEHTKLLANHGFTRYADTRQGGTLYSHDKDTNNRIAVHQGGSWTHMQKGSDQKSKSGPNLDTLRAHLSGSIKESQDPPAAAPNFRAISGDQYKKKHVVVGEAVTRDGITRYPRVRAAMEPYKQQDGDRLQKPKTRNYPTEKVGHGLRTGRPNSPRGYGASKKEWRD
jgi:hypothetical protein